MSIRDCSAELVRCIDIGNVITGNDHSDQLFQPNLESQLRIENSWIFMSHSAENSTQ